MEIKSVKLQSNGYLLNSSMSVPNDSGNREYQLIQEWIADGNTPEPEFTQDELDAIALAKMKAKAQAYLDATDWYVTRFTETGKAVPEDVLTKRAEARGVL